MPPPAGTCWVFYDPWATTNPMLIPCEYGRTMNSTTADVVTLCADNCFIDRFGIGSSFATGLVTLTATLASPAERWFRMLRDIDTPRTILALQQKTHAPPTGASPLGPTPDIMSHLYRNPAGVRCMGTLVTTLLHDKVVMR